MILRSDLSTFGSARRVSRVISCLIEADVLVRIGSGVYAKARINSLTEKPMPRATLAELGWEILQRLGVDVSLGRDAEEYASGRSTQIPMKTIFSTGNRRITRKPQAGLRRIYYKIRCI